MPQCRAKRCKAAWRSKSVPDALPTPFATMASRQRFIPVFLVFLALACAPQPSSAQADSGFSIHVESNLVVVPVAVLNKHRLTRVSSREIKCLLSDQKMLSSVSLSDPFLPATCDDTGINDLTAKDFRIFEDGIEQSVHDVKVEPRGSVLVRDNTGIHAEWSETPRGQWGTAGSPHRGSVGQPLPLYKVAYVPQSPKDSGCHQVEVKVDRRNAAVFFHDRYCSGQSPTDTLRGTALGKQLEADLESGKPGEIELFLQSGYFLSDGGASRISITAEFPSESLTLNWDSAWYQATIGILGVVNGTDGSPVARFSDLGCCSSDTPNRLRWFAVAGGNPTPNQIPQMLLQQIGRKLVLPVSYQGQISLPQGEYDLSVVLSDGEKFGRAEAHLSIPANDGKSLALSSVMLCKRYRDAHVAAVERAAANFAPQYVPMVSKGMEVTPAGDLHFKEGDSLIPYFEIYEPLLATQPDTKVEARIKILDAKTGEVVKDFPPVDAAPYMNPGSTTIPVAREVPYKELPKGAYRLEVQASDSAGRSTEAQSAEFTVE